MCKCGGLTLEDFETLIAQRVPLSAQKFQTPGGVTPSATQNSSANAIDIPNLSITIPKAGDYMVTAEVRGITSAVNSGISFGLYNAANVLQPNSQTLAVFGPLNAQGTGTMVYKITGAALGAVYKIRAWNPGGNNAASAYSDLNGAGQISYYQII